MKTTTAAAFLLFALPLSAAPKPGVRKLSAARKIEHRPAAARKSLTSSITPVYILNNALCGRITSLGVQYITDVDITNLSYQDASSVYFELIGIDQTTGVLQDTIAATLLANGANPDDTMIPAYTSLHFDDFISFLHDNGLVSDTVFSDGFLGSLYVEFDGLPDNTGQASTTTRFWSGTPDASIGAAAAGELTFLGSTDGTGYSGSAYGSLLLAGLVRDTRGEAGVPQLKPNLFINNTGVNVDSGSATLDGHDTVYVAAYDAYTGDPVGTTRTFDLAVGQTGTVADVLETLNVPLSIDQVVIYVSATDGTGVLQALTNELDDGSKDGSVTSLTPVPPAII